MSKKTVFFLTVFQILLGSPQKHYLFYLDLARLRVASILKVNIFNGPAASDISDDSMVNNTFLTNDIVTGPLQVLGAGISGPSRHFTGV